MANERTRARRVRQDFKRYRTRKEREDIFRKGEVKGFRDGKGYGRHEAREELTKQLRSPGRREGMMDEPFCLNEMPQQPFVQVHMQPGRMTSYEEMMSQRPYPEMMRCPRALFEAKKMCWESGSGQRVVWWVWEFKGVHA